MWYSHHVQTDYTALMLVARGGQMPVVKFLVEEAKADVNARDLVSHCNTVCIRLQWNPS